MRYIDVEGVATRCLLAGDRDAPALLLLHGLALTAEVWLRNVEALARSRRVVAPDMLGHGFTRPADGAAVVVPAKLRHLEGLADALGLTRFAAAGSSYGALMAAQLHLRNPGRVERLVINGSGSCFNSEAQLAGQMGRMREVYAPERLAGSTRAEWQARIGNNFHDPAKVPEALPVVAQLCYAQPWAAARLEESMAAMQEPARFRPHRILERLEEIACPTLVVWGREDRGGALDGAEAAVARLPDGRLEVFEGCGHYPMLEHPERYNGLVRDFLAGV